MPWKSPSDARILGVAYAGDGGPMLVMWSALAGAVEPPDFYAIGTYESVGTPGENVARGVAFDRDGTVVAVGQVDPGAGTDAVAVRFRATTEFWNAQWDAGPVGAERVDSDDTWAAGVRDGDVWLFCGRAGGATADPIATHRLFESAPNPVVVDGVMTEGQTVDLGDGAEHACADVVVLDADTVVTAGVAPSGESGIYVLDRSDLAVRETSFTWSDPVTALAAHPFEPWVAVVGGADNARRIEVRDVATGAVVWESVTAEGAAADVTFSEDGAWLFVTGNADVAGYVAAGDGAGAADRQWGFPLGFSSTTARIAEELGVVTVATTVAITLDPSTFEPATMAWYVAQYTMDGQSWSRSWLGESYPVPCDLEAVAVQNGVIALAGQLRAADDSQFAVVVIEGDRDGDGVTDSQDGCPDHATKTDPGICGCPIPDEADTDEDGLLDCVDRCFEDPNKGEDPGVCGCGVADVDLDRDGVLDCLEECPSDPDKVLQGRCGCGVPDDDVDRDGVLDCRDACLDTVAGVEVDQAGCGDPVEEATGCGCRGVGGATAWVWLGALLALRRRSHRNRPLATS